MHELTTIVDSCLNLRATGQAAVLASVVKTQGSTYRRPGARFLLLPDGQTLGMVSGGCLENDVRERARQTLASGEPSVAIYDGTAPDDIVWGMGLGCNGIVQVLIERLDPHQTYLERLAACLHQRRAALLATVFAVSGQTSVTVGARLLLESDGTVTTTITDPLALQTLTETAQAALAGKRSQVTRLALANGFVEVLLEAIQPPPALLIAGAGPDALPLATLARTLGWQVTVADHRPAFATAERFPMADAVVVCRPEVITERLAPDECTAAVIMTHHYASDRALLECLLPAPLRYLGLLGPRARTERLLREIGVAESAQTLQRLYGPVGIDIGAETPAQVALSIVAEIQAVFADRAGGSLRDRAGSIHEPTRV